MKVPSVYLKQPGKKKKVLVLLYVALKKPEISAIMTKTTEKLFFFSIQYYRITSHHSPMQIFRFKKISDKNVCSAKKTLPEKKKKIPKVCVNSSIF